MFIVNRLRCEMATDTMDGRFKSIHGHRYCKVFVDKYLFIGAYPIHKESDCSSALDKFVQYYCAPDLIINDGLKEQSQPGTELQKLIRKYDIKNKVSEPERRNHNRSK